MKLSEIVAELKGLKETVSNFLKDKATATTDALTSFSTRLTSLETGAVSALTTSNAEVESGKASLTSANAKLETAQGEVNAIGGALKLACKDLSLEVKDGATSVEMVALLKTAVTGTLAKLQVDATKVPSAKPAAQSQEPAKRKKSLDAEIAELNAQATK